MHRFAVFQVTVLAVAMLAVAPPAVAGTLEMGEGSDPTEDGNTGAGFNPTLSCFTAPGDTIQDLLVCLRAIVSAPPPCLPNGPDPAGETLPGEEPQPGDLEQNPPGNGDGVCPWNINDFTIDLLPSPRLGLHIIKKTGEEIDRLRAWTNDPGIESLALTVQRSGLQVWIKHFARNPPLPGGRGSSGLVTITLNSTQIVLDPGLAGSDAEFNATVLQQIQAHNFVAEEVNLGIGDTWIVVSADNNAGRPPLWHVSVDPETPAITAYEIALTPMLTIGP